MNLLLIPEEIMKLLTAGEGPSDDSVKTGSQNHYPASKVATAVSNPQIQDGEYIGAGQRDQRIFNHICSLSASGYSKEQVVADVMKKNINWDNEWNEYKVREKAEHVFRNYPAQNMPQPIPQQAPQYDLSELDVEQEAYDYANIKSMKIFNHTIRTSSGQLHTKVSRISMNILRSMNVLGTLYWNTSKDAAYYGEHSSGRFMAVNKDNMDFRSLMMKYGVNVREKMFDLILETIWVHTYEHGVKASIHTDNYYEEKEHIVYLSTFNGAYLAITPDTVESKPNGTGGVMFEDDASKESFNYTPTDSCLRNLSNTVIAKFNFSNDRLTVDEKKIILRKFIIYTYFCTQESDRPIVVLRGQKGSTKTSNARNIGLLRYGSKFDVTTISKRGEKDFDVALVNSKFIVIDNVDEKIDWLPDKLAAIATGGTFRFKKLYTTADKVDLPLNLNAIITTRTPKFNRDDIADRSIVLDVQRPMEFLSRKAISAEVLSNRNLIMSEVVTEIQRVLKIFRDSPAEITSNFRIADFASFCLRIARHDGYEESMQNILQKLSREQSRFTLEDDEENIYDLLKTWIWISNNSNRFVTNKVLWQELCTLSRKEDINFIYKGRDRAFATKMGQIRSNLEQFIDIEHRSRGGNVHEYRYSLKTAFPTF